MGASLFRSESRLLDALFEAPSPKPSAVDKAKFGKLASLYTSFSQAFALKMLDFCINEGCTTIADPFGGMGTVGEAGRTRPIDLYLGDISPFAALSGTFRTASRQEIEDSALFIKSLTSQIRAQDELAFFAQLLSAIGAGTETATRQVLEAPTKPEHRNAAFSIYLAALSRLKLHRSLSGSNPTWVKRSESTLDYSATREAVEQTIDAAKSYAEGLEPLNERNRSFVKWASLAEQAYRPGSLDAILTSPPYPNRTDYIRHYLPASELLINAVGDDERALRLKQIGTPLIRTNDLRPSLPPSITQLIEQIRTHHSYASERYYYKGFLYYFSDMADALALMRTWLRTGGLAILVVQEAYYKEMFIPVADLLIDLASSRGLSFVGRRDWRVRSMLSQLSPSSRRSVANRVVSESVVVFSR